jgi:hypothetical protein
MADDYSIRAKITGDASEFKVAMEGAAASTEQNTARIKKALEEAKVVAAGYAQAIKQDQELLATGFGSNPAGGGAPIVGDIKAKLAESEAGFAATKIKIAELQAELKGVPASSAAAASGIGLTEKQLALMGTAAEAAARQLKTLPTIQAEAAALVNGSVNEMQAVYRRATAEMSEATKILGQVQVGLGASAQEGNAQAQAAINATTAAYIRAAAVQQEVQGRLATVTTEQAAREELLARAITQSTTATLADAQAKVEATIASEGSAVAALNLANAQEATLSGAQKQADAIVNANQIIQRSQTAVAGLQAEVANQTGISAALMGTYVQRAAAEVQTANAAIKASQLALGEAITEGNAAAIASMAALQDAAVNAAAVFDGLKAQLADIESTQAAAAEAAAVQASALDVVTEVTTAAAERGQNFATIQAEVAASVGKTSVELGSTYVRAAAAASAATTALVRDGERLGPALQQGIPGAAAAMANLRIQMQQTRIAADELGATIKLKALAEEGSTVTTQAAAIQQAELAIAEHGSAVAALEAAEAAQKLAVSEERVAASSSVARVGIAELSGSTQGMIFALSRVSASIPAVQTALQYAFPVILAVAFIEILDQTINKVADLVSAFEGFGKEEKKRLEESIKDAQDAFSAFFKLRQEVEKNKEIGLSGISKLGVASANSAKDLQHIQLEMTQLTKRSDELKTALDATSSSALGIGGAIAQAIGDWQNRPLRKSGVPGTEGIEGTRAETDTEYTEVEKKKKENQVAQDKIVFADQARIRAEINAEYFRQYIAEEEKANEVAKQIADSLAERQKQDAEEAYIAKQITYKQETAAFKEAEEARHQAAVNYIEIQSGLDKRRASKGEVSADYPETRRRQEIALEELQNQKNIRQINIHDAREEEKTLKEINEQHLKDITDKLPEIGEAAPEGHGKQAQLAFLQNQQVEIDAHVNLNPDDWEKYKKALKYLAKEIPRLMGQASKETETAVKESVDEQYRAWERGGERTATQIIQFWSAIRTQYADNAKVAIEADEKITESTKKLLENYRKVNEELQKYHELEAEHADDVQKAAIERKYITTPQTSLNPFAFTPAQKEKQELGQVDLARIQQRIELNKANQQVEVDAGRNTVGNNDAYAKLQNDRLKLDNEYWAKKAALDNQKLQDEYQNYLKYYEQISGAFLKGVDEWILGQKRFSVAMFDAWRGIVTDVVHDIEQITAKWIESHLIMKALGKLISPTPQFNPGAGPGHGYGPPAPPLGIPGAGAPVPVTIVGSGGVTFGNGGLLGTGGVPKIGGPSGIGDSQPKEYDQYGFRKRLETIGAPGASGAASTQAGVAAEQKAAAQEDAIRQQELQKYITFNRAKLASDQTTAAQSTIIDVQQNAQQTATDAASKQAQVAETASAEAEKVGLTATGAAEAASVEKTANATSVLGAAKKRYAQVSANEGLNSIPFVGPAIAQAAGIAAFAATLAFGAFEKGGVVGSDKQIALLHPHEMVLPAPVSKMVQEMAGKPVPPGVNEETATIHSVLTSMKPSAVEGNAYSDQAPVLGKHQDMTLPEPINKFITQLSQVTPAYAKGGISEKETVSVLHPGEMVLPETVSRLVENTSSSKDAMAGMERAASLKNLNIKTSELSSSTNINKIGEIQKVLASSSTTQFNQQKAVSDQATSTARLDAGGFVPKEGIAMLHPGEVVVNHPVTSLLSNIAARGGAESTVGAGSGGSGEGQKSGGDTHLHMHNTVQAFDSHGMDRVLGTHGKDMIRYFKAQMRNGRFA